MNKLPEYKGWTVDFKLKEFRQVTTRKDGDRVIHTRPFTSIYGDALLGAMIKDNQVPKEVLVELF